MIDYTLTRSSRKTIGITIKDGRVFVRAPYRTLKRDIDAFVNDNVDWINKKLAAYSTKEKRFSDYIEYNKFLYRGAVLATQNTSTKRLLLKDGILNVPESFDSVKIARSIVGIYKKEAALHLEKRLKEIAVACGFEYKQFMLTNARTKWGSCSSEGLIRLNWRLILLPDGLTDYVIIHELCHTKHLDHSKEFWFAVGSFIPDYKIRRKILKSYSPIIDLFR